jgi:hypothetical protein
VRKQEQLDAALCDRYALEARLKSAEHRLRSMEGQLAEARSGPDALFDMESGEAGVVGWVGGWVGAAFGLREETVDDVMDRGWLVLAGDGGMRNRGGFKGKRGSLRPISRLGPIARNPSVAKAVDAMDRTTVAVGHYLRVYPLARLLFVVYLVLLHVWGFFVLVFHSQRLDEMQADSGAPFTKPGEPIIP